MSKKGAFSSTVAIVVILFALLLGGASWRVYKQNRQTINNDIPKNQSSQTISAPTPQKSQPEQPAEKNQKAEISIKNFAFSPSQLAIKAGTTVVWTNMDQTNHTVTSTSFNSGQIASGGVFSFTFNDKGTFTYACSIHPTMQGKITVE